MNTPEQVTEQLQTVFSAPDDVVEVMPDPFAGYRITIVSKSFADEPPLTRRARALAAIDDDSVAHLSLRSPIEAEQEIQLEDPDLGELPLWPEALAQGGKEETVTVRLPSVNQESLDPPVVATFYSLRGGVGRSTALAHSAFALARQGLSVLCIDMDLEAPGLASIFGVEGQVSDRSGVVALLTEIDVRQGPPKNIGDHIIRISERYELSLLPAGRPSAAYAQDLALVDPAAWYHEDVNPLRILMQSVRELPLAIRPDVVLIDSRTGISPVAAPLLFDAADLAIVTFYPHPQAREGTRLLTRALLAARTEREGSDGERLTPEPRFVVSPVPAGSAARQAASERAQDWVAEWLAPARDIAGEKPFAVEDVVQVVGYTEATATADKVTSSSETGPYDEIAGWIAGMVGPAPSRERTPASDFGVPNKQQVLASLNFQGQTGEKQPADSLREIFVGTHAVNAALDPSTPLVIGRKGTGKTLVFRQLLSQASGSALAITSPSGIDETQREWQISEDFYEAISDTLDGARSTWVHAWMAVIGLTLVRLDNASPPHSVETLIGAEQKYGLAAFVSDVRSLLAAPDSGIMLREWLLAIDGQRSEPLTLLFDGLDTGFGTRRDLRNEAVTGLMVLLNDLGRTFRQLRLKAFIREDIFRSLSFPNKSHLRADAAVLVWNDQTDYLRIIIRQAWRSPEFRQYAEARLAEQLRVPGGAQGFDWDTSIEYWPDDVVGMVWRLLAGERVAGGKTAFTDNWVWARLADANGDHAPRHLVELFIGATRREIDLEAAGPFPRALIRPKSLVDALEAVSESAIEALAEEFPELDPVLNGLKAVGITPFDADGLKGRDGNLVGLAAEVGVLDRGNDGDSSERYRVPEIYRKALGMSRRGQK